MFLRTPSTACHIILKHALCLCFASLYLRALPGASEDGALPSGTELAKLQSLAIVLRQYKCNLYFGKIAKENIVVIILLSISEI